MDIPCIETSDEEQICKHPVVSILMLTYNHEPYIQQAIEGVMMQRTDFQFELIIGEDASQDKTREICFEYQKRFPDKIRVLWWHENVTRYGGNYLRVRARCRGKYIALCEGDDYWIDEYKLQKQVQRAKVPGFVGCVAFNKILEMDGSYVDNVYEVKDCVDSSDFMKHYFHTSTYFFNRVVLNEMERKFNKISSWYDTVIFHCMADMGKIVLLPEIVSVRRITGRGIATSLSNQERAVLGLKQLLPLFLYGPRKWHRDFGRAILNVTSRFYYQRAVNFSEADLKRYGKIMTVIFFKLFFTMLFSPYAWGQLARMIKYRLQTP